MRSCSIAVLGATGAVGQVFLRIIEERKFPAKSIKLFASKRSVGKRITVLGQECVVEEPTPEALRGADIAFISVSGEISRQWAPIAVKAGALVIDDSSTFRMDPNVPLVVPEVNADDLRHHQGITAIPNCTTTPLVMALYPIHKVNPIRRIVVDTYQAVSGTGRAAMDELREQSKAQLDGKAYPPRVYPHPIAFNVLPHVDTFLDNGYTKEEWKIVQETRKIMHAPDIAISATTVRVPVFTCHSEAVHVELAHPMSPEEAREVMAAFPGVEVVDDPRQSRYPLALDVAGKDPVYVGRVRRDVSVPNGLAMWLVSDNLRKGAALNAIQIAEEVLKQDLLLTPERR
ncbi:MAG: aspartate-semialdehyde dehydrogenase [Chloroflexi bacterium]|nr:aspartate-semialdehyde dehydrogenase [Chloroflexota bacterium]